MPNILTEVHSLTMVSATVIIIMSHIIDIEADVSLLPLEVVQLHALPAKRHATQWPVMVNRSTPRCDGIVSQR